MKTLHVLLASSDRVTMNRIEALVHDICFERVLVEFTRTARVDDFEKLGSCSWLDLIIFSPDNLSSGTQRSSRNVFPEAIRAVREIRKRALMPLVAFGISEDDKMQVYEAGVDIVAGRLLEVDSLRAELTRVLNLPSPARKQAPVSASFFGRLFQLKKRVAKSAVA